MNRTSRSLRCAGFTLVELLVVIAIIGVLVSLLLPAVNAARESARKLQCSNNLHNLALAVIQYHDGLGYYPNATFYNQNPNDSVCGNTATLCEEWSWGVLILPYLEQQNMHNSLGVLNYSLHHLLAGANPNMKNPMPLMQTKLAVYICPSDSNPVGNLNQTRNLNTGLGITKAGLTGQNTWPGVSNYICNRGTDYRAYTSSRPDTWGVFMEVWAKRSQDITDGMSNTIMLGERDTQICNSASWVGVRNPPGTGTVGFSMVAGTSHTKLNSPDLTGTAWNATNPPGCYIGYSSLHPGGANFALCDGSVRFITNNIEYKAWNSAASLQDYDKHTPRATVYQNVYSVYSRLMRRNDGFPVGDF